MNNTISSRLSRLERSQPDGITTVLSEIDRDTDGKIIYENTINTGVILTDRDIENLRSISSAIICLNGDNAKL